MALLSNSFCRSAFAADPRVLGATVKVDGILYNYNAVGVLPPGFHCDGRPADGYAPIGLSRTLANGCPWIFTRG